MKLKILMYKDDTAPPTVLTTDSLEQLAKKPNEWIMVEDTTGDKHVIMNVCKKAK